MTKSQNIKSALLASVLSMMLCMAMLIGSTFAWFTDSVTSGMNKIVAGNLDVELYHVKDDKEIPVTANTNLFLADALWEPGHVEVVNLKVANVGTLALTYKLGINIAAEKEGTNAAGEAFRLSDYMKFALIDGNNTYDTREAAIAAAAENAVDLSDLAVNESGVLYPAAKATEENPASRYVTLVVYMPASVGNEANYKTGTEAPEIDLGVTLVAAQTPYEDDSFGKDYDKDAEYPSVSVSSAEEFKNAIKPGATITVSNDIDLAAAGYNSNNPFMIEADNVTVDLNGNTVNALNVGFKITGDNVTIKNGTINRPEGRTYSYGLKLNGVNTTVENVTIYSGINVSGYNPDDSIKPGVSAKIVNCSIILDCEWAYYAVCAQGESSVIVENVEITRTNAGKANYYFWVEKEFTDELGHVSDSYIGINYVTMNSTCDTALFNPGGLKPEDLTIEDNEFEDPFD